MTEKTCDRCGECCTHLAIGTVKELRKVARDYLKVRGAIFKGGFVLIPYRCPHLKVMTENVETPDLYKTECDIHAKKPAICKEWNGQKTVRGFPTYVPDNCTMKEHPRQQTKVHP